MAGCALAAAAMLLFLTTAVRRNEANGDEDASGPMYYA